MPIGRLSVPCGLIDDAVLHYTLPPPVQAVVLNARHFAGFNPAGGHPSRVGDVRCCA